MNSYHWHECPGVDTGRFAAKQKPHKTHESPCYNPRCQAGDKRYCGLIVDAMLRLRNGRQFLDPKYLDEHTNAEI